MIEKKCKTCYWNTQCLPKPCWEMGADGKLLRNCEGNKNWEPCTRGDLIRGLKDEDLAIVIAYMELCTKGWTTNQIEAWLGSRVDPEKVWRFEEAAT